MGVAARFIPLGLHGLFEPWNGFIPFSLFNQVSPDIVVGIAKLRINLNGFVAFGDSPRVIAEEGIRPAAKRVGLGSGEGLYGLGVELDCLLVVAGHLQFVGLAKTFSGSLARIGV